jgi:hypothetical protein
MKQSQILLAVAALATASILTACDQGVTSTPSRVVVLGGDASGAPRLTPPTPDSPGDAQQLDTLRPTLTVRNGTSTQTGARTYEFQVSDTSTFSSTTPAGSPFAVVVSNTSVPEGANGLTSFTPTQDLQPTTRFFWRARVLQGTIASDWSETRSFNSRLVGYNRPGELYDPLIYGETIGQPIGSTTFISGKGIRVNDQNSYVQYALPQTIASGEFSMEVEGLFPNGPGEKLKVFSMMDGPGDLFRSKYLLTAMYRGVNGNPANCIAFKALFGDEDYKLEPDLGVRNASVMSLDPSKTYYWKATWNSEFRLVVQEGIGGTTLYNFGITSPGGSYNPSPHFAYLGANNGPYGEETGAWPGAVYRNVWLSSRPRPASLGSALNVR